MSISVLVVVVVALVAVVVVTILSWRSRRPWDSTLRATSANLRPIRPVVGPASGPGIDPTAAWWQATAEPASPPVGLPRPGPPSASPPRAPVASGIFLSYRRTDSSHAARNVAQALRSHFDGTDVFMDVDSLAAGVNFVQGVVTAIDTSGVVLVLIGDRWLSARDDQGRSRLHNPRDHVRTEIEQAFRMGKVVLPVLLDASMPGAEQLPASLGPLTTVNAVRLDHDSWDADLTRLVEAVARLRS